MRREENERNSLFVEKEMGYIEHVQHEKFVLGILHT